MQANSEFEMVMRSANLSMNTDVGAGAMASPTGACATSQTVLSDTDISGNRGYSDFPINGSAANGKAASR